MFSMAERTALRAALITAARTDQRITGIALTGSGALGTEDRWSDIDLAFGFAAGTDLGAALRDWTAVMYADHGAVDHMDVISGGVTYRVFLLASTLQVDLAFAPAAEFGAVAETSAITSWRWPACGTAWSRSRDGGCTCCPRTSPGRWPARWSARWTAMSSPAPSASSPAP